MYMYDIHNNIYVFVHPNQNVHKPMTTYTILYPFGYDHSSFHATARSWDWRWQRSPGNSCESMPLATWSEGFYRFETRIFHPIYPAIWGRGVWGYLGWIWTYDCPVILSCHGSQFFKVPSVRASFPTTRSAKAGRHCGSVGAFRMCQGFPGGVL